MARAHGSLRGLRWVDRSTLAEGRFGRMFRWLPGERYEERDLSDLAAQMIQQEVATLRDVSDPNTSHVPKNELFAAGPDVLLKTPGLGERFDTALGEPEPEDENPTIPAGYTYFGQYIDHDLTYPFGLTRHGQTTFGAVKMLGDGELRQTAKARHVERRWRAASAEFRPAREFASN